MPILFAVQEITVRLGVMTGKGHGQLIRERFGFKWGLLSGSTLVLLSAIGSLLTEFAGVAGVGELFGISRGSPSRRRRWFPGGIGVHREL